MPDRTDRERVAAALRGLFGAAAGLAPGGVFALGAALASGAQAVDEPADLTGGERLEFSFTQGRDERNRKRGTNWCSTRTGDVNTPQRKST